MPALSGRTKLSTAAFVYLALGRLLGGLLCVLLGIVAISLAEISTGSSGGTTFPLGWTGAAIIALGIIAIAYTLLYYSLLSYTFAEHTVTVDSGVIFRDSRTIDFARIQSIDNKRNPIHMLLGITAVDLWTASQDQSELSISGTSREVSITAHPEVTLMLPKTQAEAIREKISKIGGQPKDV